MINSVCGHGSTGVLCSELAEHLIEHGNECVVAFGRDDVIPPRAEKYAYRIGTDFGVKLHGVKTRIFDAHGLGSVNATRTFISWIEEYDPDIIHLHNIHGYYINIKILFEYLKKCGKPVIWTLHDCWAFTGHCAHYDYVGCSKWKNGCGNCPQKNKYPGSVFADASARNYRIKKELFTKIPNLTLVTPSEWLAEQVKESFFADKKICVINNGIDTEVFKPTESNIKERFGIIDKKIALGVAGVWDDYKGLKYMPQLAQLLGDDWQLVLVGLNRNQLDEYRKNILGICRTRNQAELAEWYSAADVYVNPTLEDTYPTTNLEAQCCGTPVVTFDSGGSPESIYPTVKDAAVCKKGCAEELAEGVKTDSEQDISDELSAWAREKFSVEKFVEKYFDLYKRTIL